MNPKAFNLQKLASEIEKLLALFVIVSALVVSTFSAVGEIGSTTSFDLR
jgi:hypothetical protein